MIYLPKSIFFFPISQLKQKNFKKFNKKTANCAGTFYYVSVYFVVSLHCVTSLMLVSQRHLLLPLILSLDVIYGQSFWWLNWGSRWKENVRIQVCSNYSRCLWTLRVKTCINVRHLVIISESFGRKLRKPSLNLWIWNYKFLIEKM